MPFLPCDMKLHSFCGVHRIWHKRPPLPTQKKGQPGTPTCGTGTMALQAEPCDLAVVEQQNFAMLLQAINIGQVSIKWTICSPILDRCIVTWTSSESIWEEPNVRSGRRRTLSKLQLKVKALKSKADDAENCNQWNNLGSWVCQRRRQDPVTFRKDSEIGA